MGGIRVMTADADSLPASPCIGVCRLDDAGALCVGCQRTPAEIGAWPRAGRAERERILAAVAARRPVSSGGLTQL